MDTTVGHLSGLDSNRDSSTEPEDLLSVLSGLTHDRIRVNSCDSCQTTSVEEIARAWLYVEPNNDVGQTRAKTCRRLTFRLHEQAEQRFQTQAARSTGDRLGTRSVVVALAVR